MDEQFVLPDNYIFNEQRKRFDPLEKKCAYCNKALMDDIEDCYFSPVFMTKNRTYLVVYSSVKYAKILIGIPRCKSCKKIHENAKVKGVLISVITGIIVIPLGIMARSVALFVMSFFGGIFIAVFGSFYLKDWFSSQKGIKPLKEAAKENGLVKKFLEAGWSLKQPEA